MASYYDCFDELSGKRNDSICIHSGNPKLHPHCSESVTYHTIFLDEHKLTYEHKFKDSPGRTGDSWRISTTGVIANALLASPPRALRKASGSGGRILAHTLLFCTALEKSLPPLQLLDEHQLISQQKLKDSPGRTGDSWRISVTGVIANALLASPPHTLRKASGSVGRILARTLLFCTALEKSLPPLQLLNEHQLISQH
ncbi:hypothetical protein DV702_08685 [Sporosarcina sp. PTS2304]|nr:hypothetical protein DV702_08685 [Sporosarcina sp. PTS2304]